MKAPKLTKIECGVVIGCDCCGNLWGMDSYGSAAPVDTMAQYFWPTFFCPTFQPSKALSCWHVSCLKEIWCSSRECYDGIRWFTLWFLQKSKWGGSRAGDLLTGRLVVWPGWLLAAPVCTPKYRWWRNWSPGWSLMCSSKCECVWLSDRKHLGVEKVRVLMGEWGMLYKVLWLLKQSRKAVYKNQSISIYRYKIEDVHKWPY